MKQGVCCTALLFVLTQQASHSQTIGLLPSPTIGYNPRAFATGSCSLGRLS